mmetsp:Transcript_25093/g.60388  ORF Transcript_25093/g.60388 Transcript_25093/m.60388 type:complete len:90 (-) Transcript_25093:663-932(-)
MRDDDKAKRIYDVIDNPKNTPRKINKVDRMATLNEFSKAPKLNIDMNGNIAAAFVSVDENLRCCVQNVVSFGCRYSNSIGSGLTVPRSA